MSRANGHEPPSRQSRLETRLAIITALLLALAGCSSSSSPTTRNAATGNAGHLARPDDACTLLSSHQVAAAVGTSGPYTGADEDPDPDGKPVWGCTWGTQTSYVDLREMTAADFDKSPDPSAFTTKPVSGIGDKARLDTMNPDARNPELLFSVGGAYYDLSVSVSRFEDAGNAGQEEKAERALAKLLVPKLGS